MQKLNDGLLEINSAGDVETLARATLRVIRDLIPCDRAVFGERVEGGAFRSDAFISPGRQEFLKYEDAYELHWDEHPLNRYIEKNGETSAVTLRECVEQQRWHRTGLYNEFFRPLRIESLLACAFTTETVPYVAIGVARDGRDFDRDDRFLLNLFRPHIKRAYDAIAQRMVNGLEILLTPREREVLAWAAAGKTNGQIGIILEVSPRTVQKHLEHIFQKLSVETRTSAVVRAMELKLIDPDGL